MNLVLQDENVMNDIKWGKLYGTDQFAFENINFKTEIKATDEEKIISIEKNTTE